MQKDICIFSRLFDKLTQNCVFSVKKKVVKQVDGCPMGGAISVITSDINMNRLEKERVMPLKPKFYKRYVDGTITKIKKNTDIDKLIRSMNSQHPKLTQLYFWMEFLAKTLMVLLLLTFFANLENFQHFENLRCQKDVSGITYKVTCIVLLKLLQILMQKSTQTRENI